jgi:CDP-glycerol glycerophosphotransferase (TagB/SpsB family)
MTTPGLDVYQLKRSKGVKHYSHVLHAPSDASLYRLFGLDYFDSVLLTGDYQAKDIRTLERQRAVKAKELVTVGCAYLDVYAEKMRALATENNTDDTRGFTVLVSPSWGPSALLSKYGEKLLEPLIGTGWNIILRPHPQSKTSEKDMLDRLTEKYKEQKNFVWDYETDNIFSLSKADVMISDFSGIIFDYAFLCDKPVFYVSQDIDLRPYDAEDICSNETGGKDLKKLWQFRVVEEFGIKLKEEMFGSIGTIIKSVSDSSDLKTARRKAKDEAWMYRGEAGKRIADFIIQIAQGDYEGARRADPF